LREPKPIGNEASQHLLSGKRPGYEITEVESAHRLSLEPGVSDGRIGSADRQSLDRSIGMFAERR
jgi:hypothetical protein